MTEELSDKDANVRPWLRRWGTAASLLLLVALSTITSIDRYAEREYEALFQRAFITFALARTLNGLISAVQGTELALQPAGVGVTLTPGEILDPVNDLVERFSWIMLAATISLGVQQVLLDVGQWWGLRVLVALLGLLWLWVRLRRATSSGEAAVGDASAVERTLFRVFIVVLFVRFAVPVAVIANEALYHLFLQSRYQQSQQVIESAGADLEQATLPARDAEADNGAEAPGLIESLGRSLSGTREALDFRQRLDSIRRRASEVIEHLIQLSVVFVLQTAILPLAFLWIFLQLARQIFRQIVQNRD